MKQPDSLGCSPLSIFLFQTNDTISFNVFYEFIYLKRKGLNVENLRSVTFKKCRLIEDWLAFTMKKVVIYQKREQFGQNQRFHISS